MTQKFIPQAELATLFKSSSLDVLQAVKASPHSRRWDNIGINRRSEWLDTIQKNIETVSRKIDDNELTLKQSKFGCSFENNVLTIDHNFINNPSATLDEKAKILFQDMASLLTIAQADPAPAKDVPIRSITSLKAG